MLTAPTECKLVRWPSASGSRVIHSSHLHLRNHEEEVEEERAAANANGRLRVIKTMRQDSFVVVLSRINQ